MKAGFPVAACVAALLLLLPGPGAAAPDPRGAAAVALFAKAEEAFTALRGNAAAQRQRQNFTRVLDAYRTVFEKHPSTRLAEESLLRSGELMTLLFRWTGQPGDLNRAQNYYQRLVQTAPRSPLADDALLAIGFLYLDHFKDPSQAWLRFRDVTQLTPHGDKVPEAKRQLKRLAAYAQTERPAPAADPVDLPCPVPAPAAAAADFPDTGVAAPLAAPSANSAPAPLLPAAGAPGLTRIRGIRHWSNPEYSRVVIDLDQTTNFYSNLLEDRSGTGKPPRLYVDLFGSLVEERFCKPIVVNDGILHGIRAGQYTPDSVRVVLEIDGLRTYRVFPMQNPYRIIVDVTGGEPGPVAALAAPFPPPAPGAAAAAPVAADTPEPPAAAKYPPRTTAAAPALSVRLAPLSPAASYKPEPVPELRPLPSFGPVEPPRAGVDPTPEPPAPAAAPAPTPPAAAPTTYSGVAAPVARPAPPAPARVARPEPAAARAPDLPAPSAKPSLARQLGLGVRRVIVDAGHGAHDPGAIGVGGLQEKDVTLDLALRIRELLRAAGYEAVLTRDRDVYLPLEERTAIANTARGDLFLSLHCNASDAGNLSGVETYFLNLASSVRAMKTAARENSMAVANMSDLQQIVREIQNSKMDESSQFAARVQRSLHDALRRKFPDSKDLGVKQAPFYVLIGAQMPSILAEVSFINHRKEGRRLADPATRQLIAQALVDGVKRYVRTVKTAALAQPGRPAP